MYKTNGGDALQALVTRRRSCLWVDSSGLFRDFSGWLGKGLAGRVLTLLPVIIAGLILVRPCLASQLLAVGTSAADNALNGATVAEPKTPVGAMFSNPAGLALFKKTTIDMSAGVSTATTKVDASVPPTYADDNSFLVIAPGMGLAVAGEGPWHYGFAAYGSVGARFDFDANPAAGVNNDFFSESSVLTFASGLAYRFSDQLSVGAAITPLLGRSKSHFTQQNTLFRFKLSGPGIQGMFGLRWEPRDGLALGIGARTPGRVWMHGDMHVVGARQDVHMQLKMPAQVFLGVTKHLGERTTVSAAFRWSDTSSFGDSLIKFELIPSVSFPFVPKAKDEYLVSMGVEYVWSDLLTLRLGCGHSNAIVGTKGVSSLLFDTEDWRAGGGFGLNFDNWSLDFMAGYGFKDSRTISAAEAAGLPGRYGIEGQIAMIGVTWYR